MTKSYIIGGFMFELSARNVPLRHSDERPWLEVIDRVYVRRNGQITLKTLRTSSF